MAAFRNSPSLYILQSSTRTHRRLLFPTRDCNHGVLELVRLTTKHKQKTTELTICMQHPIGPHLLRAYAPSSNHSLLPQPPSTEYCTTHTCIARSISCSEPRLRQRRRLAPLHTSILNTRQHLLQDRLAPTDANACSVQPTGLYLSSGRNAARNLLYWRIGSKITIPPLWP